MSAKTVFLNLLRPLKSASRVGEKQILTKLSKKEVLFCPELQCQKIELSCCRRKLDFEERIMWNCKRQSNFGEGSFGGMSHARARFSWKLIRKSSFIGPPPEGCLTREVDFWTKKGFKKWPIRESKKILKIGILCYWGGGSPLTFQAKPCKTVKTLWTHHWA